MMGSTPADMNRYVAAFDEALTWGRNARFECGVRLRGRNVEYCTHIAGRRPAQRAEMNVTYDHAFMDFAASESAQLESDAAWLAWVRRAEAILGHDLDGDNSANSRAAGTADGYSLDDAYDAYLRHERADDYARAVKSDPAYRAPVNGVLASDRSGV